MAKVLIVDDEPGMRRILEVNLRREGHVSIQASGAGEAIQLLNHEDFDVVLTDQQMPDGTGLDVLRAALDSDQTTSVIFLTGVGTIELAVESMRQGAFDFITKPFVPDVVQGAVRRATERTSLLRENAVLKSAVKRLEGADEILGQSPAMCAVRELIGRVAVTNSTVLITGETGTGKELVARAIHRNSSRSEKAFIAINCAAVAETLLESELFGHERGAFTGADKAHAGLFEAAHEGTLFLDEVAEMSSAAQAKLLRVLADGQIQRVGSTSLRRVNVRILAATHRSLEDRVRQGMFREDLYYRLAVVPIQLPALRDRREDMSELCRALSRRIANDMKVPIRTLSPAALSKLSSYTFPGNIRELRNLLERALILGRGTELQPEDFLVSSQSMRAPQDLGEFTIDELVTRLPERLDFRETMVGIEKAIIGRSLKMANGVQAEAARKLGLTRSDVGYKVAKYALATAGKETEACPAEGRESSYE